MTTPIRRRSPSGVAVLVGLVLIAGVAGDQRAQAREDDDARCGEIPPLPPPSGDWPRIRSEIPRDPVTEAIVGAMVSRMTLAEKVGQMTQAEIQSITPAEVRQYHIGSVLNGGGSWPNNDKHATPSAWLALADAYWDAALAADGSVKIPIMWGIDAVHGNSNVFGATLFPHNIGLGAARDPCLVRRIARATAEQVRVTGQDWAFAPTLAVVRDDRWGRTYEGFSEDPAITRAYAAAYVDGLQGGGEDREDRSVRRLGGVLATAKHFIGDGGTAEGRDQGVNPSPEAILREIHGQGYFGALGAGAQTVMISFSSWTNEQLGITEGKVHGSRYLITDVLKGKMGFDGLVVSDWNGIGQVAGCSNFNCAKALNAGIDVFMVPAEWRQFIANTIQLVKSGDVPESRINDAVTRILRVKMRAGLFGAPRPSQRRLAGDADALVHRELAREAAQRSAVLLKNNRSVLPLVRNKKVLVVGKGANSFSIQTGGWTLSWQGTGNTNADFPTGETVLAGIRRVVGDANVSFNETAQNVDLAQFGAVIAVIGETPYAEGVGDIGKTRTLEHAARYPSDLVGLNRVVHPVEKQGPPVVTIFFSGRPAYVNKELNRSDAFIAAFLPGTEAGSIADLLFLDARGRIGRGFSGKLSYSWPAAACQTPLNLGDKPYEPLFKYGFGLGYRDQVSLGTLDDTSPPIGCGQTPGGGTATQDLEIHVRGNVSPYVLYIGAPVNWGGMQVDENPTAVTTLGDISVQTADVNVQGDGRRVTWTGTGQIYAQSQREVDLRSYLNADAALVFDAIVGQSPAGPVKMRVDCTYPCFGEVDTSNLFSPLNWPLGVRRTVKIPLQCFSANGTDMSRVNTPLLIYTEHAFQLSFANVRRVPGAAKDPDVTACDAL